MHWKTHACEVRSLRAEDAASLARQANNPRVSANLRDRVPWPYTVADAEAFLAATIGREPEIRFAIDVGGEAVGAVGFELHDDIERCTAEVGYWLGEEFWGRGILTDVLCTLTPWAIESFDLTRVFAVPFADNPASHRVLEKAGYQLEGVMRRSAIKAGEVKDQRLYAYVPDPSSDG